MFNVLTQIDGGEFIFVASRDELAQAQQLVHDLNISWPRKYVVHDSDGKDVDPNGSPAIYTKSVIHEPPSSSHQYMH